MKTVPNCNPTSDLSTTVASRFDFGKPSPAVVPSGQTSQVEPGTLTARERLLMEVEMELRVEREIRTKKFMERVARQDKVNLKLPKDAPQKSSTSRNSSLSLEDKPIYRAPKRFGIGRLPSPESLVPPEQRKTTKSFDESTSKKKNR